MKNKKTNIFLLLIILLGVTIGFALLSRQLNIFGTSNITASKWDIHWDNIANIKGIRPTVGAHITDSARTIVEYQIDFTDPGDFYEFEVDAVNEGTMDAEIIEIVSTVNGGEISSLPNYIKYSVKYADGTDPQIGDVLAKKSGDTPTRRTYKVRVYYDETLVTEEILENMPDEGLDYVFNFKVRYKQVGVPLNRFETDPWETIAEIGPKAAEQEEAIDGVCGDYNVGDTKTVDMGDLGVHTVRIANCSTPTICSEGGFSQTACGFVVEFADIVTKFHMNSHSAYSDLESYPDGSGTSLQNGEGSKGGWKYSKMRAYLNGTTYAFENTDYSENSFLSKLPSDLQSVIVPTFAVSGHGGFMERLFNNTGDTSNFFTEDKLYLLAPHEVWTDDNPSDGRLLYRERDTMYYFTRQLDYYEGLGVTASNYSGAGKKYGSENREWWLRSAFNMNWYNFYAVNDNGYPEYYSADLCGGIGGNCTSYYTGVSPAFKVG